MDLTGARLRGTAAAAALAACAAGCASESPSSFSDDAILLPATLLEALPIAERVAHDWSDTPQLTALGGGFAVMDAEGRGLNHTYEFHARFGQQFRKLTVHLVSGVPWTQEEIVPSPPPPLAPDAVLDSDAVVGAAVDEANLLNGVTPGTVPAAEAYAARLLSVPVWPEPQPSADSVAWRIDFLELDEFSNDTPVPVWWSLARFYVNPETGQFLGPPEIPPTGRELYPYP